MLTSLVDSSRCATVKKRVYMPRVADEYNSSSQPLNAVVLASILSMVSPPSNKKLRQGYIVDLAREGGVSPCALMLGLLYIKRLSNTNPDYVRLISPRDLFLVSMVVASKYMNDEGEMEALTNSDWAKLGCMTKTTLDELERNFLSAIDWKLYVPLEEYYTFVNSIEARIALDQATRRGWFTYTDLTAVWDATEIQSSMMFATKQTAKVATKGAALYLMCVATLFAASGTLPLTQDLSLQLSTSSGAISQSAHAQEAANYLGHAHAPPTPQQQQMYYDHHAVPDFDAMDTVHRKKKSSNRLDLSQMGVIPSARSDKIMYHDRVVSMSKSGAPPTSLDSTIFMLMGGSGGEESVHSRGDFKMKTGTDKHSDGSSGGSIDQETLLPVNSNSPGKKRRTDNTWNTWSKFEDGILLLLNLVASITVSSAAKGGPSTSRSSSIPPPSPSPTPPAGNPESPPTATTSKQSYNHDIHMINNAMGSETASLLSASSAVPSKLPSCRDHERNVLWNVAAHWWDGRKPQACLADDTSECLTSSHNPLVAPRRKHSATVDYSSHQAVSMDTYYRYEAVSMDTYSSYDTASKNTYSSYETVTMDTYKRYGALSVDPAANRCTCAPSHSVTLGPVLSTGQVAVDLNWQGGGTGDQAISYRDFFNHSGTTLSGDWKNFTLTENLLLYANSLLTMAF